MQEMRKEWLEGSPMLEVIERRLAICRCLLSTLRTGCLWAVDVQT